MLCHMLIPWSQMPEWIAWMEWYSPGFTFAADGSRSFSRGYKEHLLDMHYLEGFTSDSEAHILVDIPDARSAMLTRLTWSVKHVDRCQEEDCDFCYRQFYSYIFHGE